MTEFAKRSATTLFITGAIAIIFGLVALFAPLATSITLVILWGAYALVDGVIQLVLAFRKEGRPARGFLIFSGVIGILAGLFVLFQPVAGGQVLGWVLGFWLLVRGILEFAAAFGSDGSSPRWLQILSGVFWVLAGILFLANPGAAILTFALWLGILALIWGVLLLGAGFTARKSKRDAAA